MKLKYVGESGNVPTVGKLVQGQEYDSKIFSPKVLKDFSNRNLLVSIPTKTESKEKK